MLLVQFVMLAVAGCAAFRGSDNAAQGVSGPPGSEEWVSLVNKISQSRLIQARVSVRGDEVPVYSPSIHYLGTDLTFEIPITKPEMLRDLRQAIVSGSAYSNNYLLIDGKMVHEF
jgi:hypothetical protein